MALTREREKLTRVTEIARAEHVSEIEKAERKSAREWSGITTGLQKQLGEEQKRVVELQKHGTRSERAYQLRTAALEEKLGAEHAARLREQDDYKVASYATLIVVPPFSIYDLFPFWVLYRVHKVTLAMVDKLKQSKKEANHKLRNLRQRLGRQNVQPDFRVVDLSEIDGPEEGTDEDMRAELALLKAQLGVENDRLRRLVYDAGKGRPKSPEFEFAARTILATGIPKPLPPHSIYH